MRIYIGIPMYGGAGAEFISSLVKTRLILDKLGYEVERFALKSNESELVDAEDHEELTKTSYILYDNKSRIISIASTYRRLSDTEWLSILVNKSLPLGNL